MGHAQQRNLNENRSNWITKRSFSEEIGLPVTTLNGWQKRYWLRGYHYTVIGRTTLINRERIELWIISRFDADKTSINGSIKTRK